MFQLSLKQIEANGDVLRAMGDTLKPGLFLTALLLLFYYYYY